MDHDSSAADQGKPPGGAVEASGLAGYTGSPPETPVPQTLPHPDAINAGGGPARTLQRDGVPDDQE